jgi:glycosyltransferase involved in cell wall biosynthesis
MNTYVYPADQTGCGYYRLIWPSLALKLQGHNIKIVNPDDPDLQFHAAMKGDQMVDVKLPADADVIVLQRTTHRYLVDAVRLMRERGVTVVIDVDDDLTCIDHRNPAWTHLHPDMGHPEHNWQTLTEICRIASYVTVSTPALLKTYAAHGRGHVIHNYVPRFFTDVQRQSSDVIGWGGSIHSHPGDLQMLGQTIQRLQRTGNRFTVVGSDEGLAEVVGEAVAERVETTGVIDFHKWSEGLAQLGVGVAPLADTKFNKAKSWLKPLEYAACGVVPVVSPRAEYRRFVATYGIGYLADGPSDWYRFTKKLADDELTREGLVGENRRLVREHLTIEGNAWRWAEAWAEARKIDTA